MTDTATAAAAAASGDDDGVARRLPAGDDHNEVPGAAVAVAGEAFYPHEVEETSRAATNEVLIHKAVILWKYFDQIFCFYRAMHCLHSVRPSVCNVDVSWAYRLD